MLLSKAATPHTSLVPTRTGNEAAHTSSYSTARVPPPPSCSGQESRSCRPWRHRGWREEGVRQKEGEGGEREGGKEGRREE